MDKNHGIKQLQLLVESGRWKLLPAGQTLINLGFFGGEEPFPSCPDPFPVPHKPRGAQHFPPRSLRDQMQEFPGMGDPGGILGIWITPEPLGTSRELSPGLGWPRVTRDSGKGLEGKMGKV